jgi:hypothetical protein
MVYNHQLKDVVKKYYCCLKVEILIKRNMMVEVDVRVCVCVCVYVCLFLCVYVCVAGDINIIDYYDYFSTNG